MISLFKSFVRFRELIGSLTSRALKSRYRGSALGKAWLVLQPLCYLAIYMTVFGHIFGAGAFGPDVPKALFPVAMFCGLIPWLAFAESVSSGSSVISQSGSLLKKYAFPSEILPLTSTLVGLFSAVIGFGLLIVAVFVFLGHPPRMLWLFPIMLFLQGVFTLGLVLFLSSVTVYIRDLSQMIPMVITLWFFMSPIFMFAKTPGAPGLLRTILRLNPMTYLIGTYREIFVWTPELLNKISSQKFEDRRESIALSMTEPGQVPWAEVGIFAACAFVMLILGLATFRRLKAGFADIV